MGKTNRTVVRNERYRKNEIGIRERHNERKNEVYSNPDVLLEYSKNNVVFKTCETTYRQEFDRLEREGVISTRGLQKDAFVFDELVFDVNTDYFEQHGGYEFAREFYSQAYELAKEIAGGEQYILSAVMHSDERNREASERLGRDVFHYHLHVVYLPVVEKQIKWSKRTKDPALRGKVRETIMQVSHSKKWPHVPLLDKDGKPVLKANGKPKLISSYHYLQTDFFKHMKEAGFPDIERGVEGSNARHLDVLDFKIQQDKQQVQALEQEIGTLGAAAQQAAKQRDRTQTEVRAAEKQLGRTRSHQTEVEAIHARSRKKKLTKTVELPAEDYSRLVDIAQQAVVQQNAADRLQSKVYVLEDENARLEQKWREVNEKYRQLYEKVQPYLKAVKLAPDRIAAAISEVFRQHEAEREERQQKKPGRRANRRENTER